MKTHMCRLDFFLLVNGWNDASYYKESRKLLIKKLKSKDKIYPYGGGGVNQEV